LRAAFAQSGAVHIFHGNEWILPLPTRTDRECE
jgi:hypothetical protein